MFLETVQNSTSRANIYSTFGHKDRKKKDDKKPRPMLNTCLMSHRANLEESMKTYSCSPKGRVEEYSDKTPYLIAGHPAPPASCLNVVTDMFTLPTCLLATISKCFLAFDPTPSRPWHVNNSPSDLLSLPSQLFTITPILILLTRPDIPFYTIACIFHA